MSSMVCQGLQSCLEPRFVEPRTMGLKMVATKSYFLKPIKWAQSPQVSESSESDDSDIDEGVIENNDIFNNNFTSNDNIGDNKSIGNDNDNTHKDFNSNGEFGGWSFLQALTKTTQSETKEEKEKPYVHPLNKRSSSNLSNKSLELCTETLGSETGSDIGDMDFSYSDSESNKSPTKERSKSLRHTFGSKKVNYGGSLPPPLTSISGSNCVSIRPHREGGRLVMKAVFVPSTKNTCFQAERRDGRLQLHYIKNSISEAASQQDQEQVEHKVIQEDYLDDEEIDGNNANVGGEMGMGKIQRPSRCKEGGRGTKGLMIWEPFWVATS